jgi:hypothetical protein
MANYKPPKAQAQRNRDGRYISFQVAPRLNKVTADLGMPTECGTILGGKKVWQHGETIKRGRKQRHSFPVIIGGTKCGEPALTAVWDGTKTVRRCAKHIGVEWIPDEE